MPKKNPPLEIAEISGDRYPDLETAQRLALQPFSAALADTLRGLLASGVLALEEGHIVVPTSQKKGTEHV